MEKFNVAEVIKAQLRIMAATYGSQYMTERLLRRVDGEQRQALGRSPLGTPMFDWVQLKVDNLTVDLHTALIEAYLPKVIKETQVQGKNGTVKEYIALGDWQVTIRGVLVSEKKDFYPLAEQTALLGVAAEPVQVACVSEYLQALDINSLVIKQLKLSQRRGGMGVIDYELQAVSDEPYELEVRNV